jgi:hypothetical protein
LLRTAFALAILTILVVGCVPPLHRPIWRTVVATGLTAPRQLAIAPDGGLYVAEVGDAASGGSVVRIGSGRIERVANELPYADYQGNEEVGTSGLALRHGEFYVVQGEGGGPLGSQLLRVRPGRRLTDRIADFLAFEKTRHPSDPRPESNPFAIVYDLRADTFYVVDSAANDLLRVSPAGAILVVAAWGNDDVPTGLAFGPDDNIYVALFSPYPYRPGAGRVDRVLAGGTVETAAAGLTTPIGIAFGADGALYVLQLASGYRERPPIEFIPNSGSILRVTASGTELVVTGLSYPTAIVADSAGALFVSENGAFSAPRTGRIDKVTVR